ncbi:MAG: permease [Xanthomonadaceae bacterium]|nr:permease [Xanthomonadaceae bacterium]
MRLLLIGSGLGAYLRGLLALRCFAVLCGLGGLFQVLDLLETSTDILSRGQGFPGIAQYTALRSPSVLLQALPLAALLGAIFSFSTLSRQNEICAMRAAGLPFRRVLLALLPTVVAIGVLHGLLAEVVVPRAQKALTAWWASLPPSPDKDPDTELLWFRTAGAVVGVATVMPDGRRLDEVRIYRRDDAGRLLSRTVAARAEYADGQWTLIDAQPTDLQAGRHEPVQARLPWDTRLKPADLMRLSASEPYVSGGLAAQVLAGSQSGTKTDSFYRTRIARAWSDPLAALVMLLLATPVAIALTRGGAGGAQVLGALATGLVFLLVNGLLSALGEAGSIAPQTAAWLAPALFALLGLVFVFRLDRH